MLPENDRGVVKPSLQILQDSWMPWWSSRPGGTQVDMLKQVLQENLSGVPLRVQWQVDFEAPGSILAPLQEQLLGSLVQGTSLMLGTE